jgi:proline iminopeptidase
MDVSSTQYQLFPEIEPHERGMLDLDGHHTMYWEVSGNPDGKPVVFLHGGPGAGSSPAHRRFFDPDHYRIIVLDQRGSGRSTPYADTTDNTTQHLIADLEKLRRHLAVEKWLVFGGSWGSALGLAYGIEHPERVSGFVLRGIFLCRDSELQWFLGGIAQVFPERWREFEEFLPASERGPNLLASYHRRLTSPDASVHLPAARVWARFEGACSTLLPNPRNVSGFDSGRAALALARLEAHYFVNKLYLPDDHFFAQLDRIRYIPGVIVQGRYDMICPITTADALHRAWPEAEYVVVPDAGHSAMEPSIRSALVAATEKFKRY